MVAVAKGFLDIVYALHVCPHIDINHQDADGNTALMIAAQAGRKKLHHGLYIATYIRLTLHYELYQHYINTVKLTTCMLTKPFSCWCA